MLDNLAARLGKIQTVQFVEWGESNPYSNQDHQRGVDLLTIPQRVALCAATDQEIKALMLEYSEDPDLMVGTSLRVAIKTIMNHLEVNVDYSGPADPLAVRLHDLDLALHAATGDVMPYDPWQYRFIVASFTKAQRDAINNATDDEIKAELNNLGLGGYESPDTDFCSAVEFLSYRLER